MLWLTSCMLGHGQAVLQAPQLFILTGKTRVWWCTAAHWNKMLLRINTKCIYTKLCDGSCSTRFKELTWYNHYLPWSLTLHLYIQKLEGPLTWRSFKFLNTKTQREGSWGVMVVSNKLFKPGSLSNQNIICKIKKHVAVSDKWCAPVMYCSRCSRTQNSLPNTTTPTTKVG